MKKYKIPIDFTVRADTPEEAKERVDEFLLQTVMDYRVHYSIVNYEAPYGYPVEEVSDL